MSYTHTTTVPLSYADAVELTKQVLSEQGFGVLSEIDVRSTFEDKLGVEAAARRLRHSGRLQSWPGPARH
ncbi:hypothetical protein [Arthrobacter pigmenti]